MNLCTMLQHQQPKGKEHVHINSIEHEVLTRTEELF